MKKVKILFATVTMLLAMASCNMGHDYNLAINPPAQTDTPAQIFPEDIGGDKAKINKLNFGGLECLYGEDKSITVARLSSEDEAVAYFKQNLLPQFKKQNNNFSGTVNGQFYAKAGGDWKMFGWVNNNFAFSVKATDDEKLQAVIDQFKFIQNK